MFGKRKLKCLPTILLKKRKLAHCYFPLGIPDLVRKITSYLDGDYLKHFKLACKSLNEATKDMSCAIQITKENYERTISTPGYHIIKMNEREMPFDEYDELVQAQLCPEVKHLIVDYCGIYSGIGCITYVFLESFEKLHSLRIIRCIENIAVTIHKGESLSHLEIYTDGYIHLTLFQKLEKGLLCSTQELIRDKATIEVESPIMCTCNIKCYSKKSTLKCTDLKFIPTLNGFFEDFVPKAEFLQ